MTKILYIDVDGSSDNKLGGDAGTGCYFRDSSNNELGRLAKYHYDVSNNEAEYLAIIDGLEAVVAAGDHKRLDKVIINSDSRLATQQIKMHWQVKNKKFINLRKRVYELLSKFKDFDVEKYEGSDITHKLANDARRSGEGFYYCTYGSSAAISASEENINKSKPKMINDGQMSVITFNKRPGWDEYFMSMAYLTAQRSSCLRRKVGAVIVKNKRVLATGYNGAPKGMETCLKKSSCMRNDRGIPSGTELQICYALHAEMNALLQTAILTGASTEKSVIYCTHFPCSLCTKMIIQAGITKIVYSEGYPDEFAKELLEESEVKIDKVVL